MDGNLFIAPGDVTQLAADAIAFSASTRLSASGTLYPSFVHRFPAFAKWYAEQRQESGPVNVGDAFWLSLGPDRKPHGIVVVAATGGRATEEDKAAIAVRAAVDTAVEKLRKESKRRGRLLIALPAFRLGMGGDRHDRVRSATAQVGAALEALGRHKDVDVAFITYTHALYRIFVEARRQVLGAPPAHPAPPAELVTAVLAGECVLFVGAGLSRGAGLPDWGELVNQLAGELEVRAPDRLDYLDLAQWYREKFGGEALDEIIRRTFGDPRRAGLPTLGHYLLLALPVRLVLTTNYDGLIEHSLDALKRPAVQVVRQEDVPRTGQQKAVFVVKLHGDAARSEGIVLCRDDYDEFFERRPAMALLLEGLLLNRTFLFVGYSLRDPNFRQLYSRIGRMLKDARRPAFATSFEAGGDTGPHAARQWKNKQLELVSIPGKDLPDQDLQFLRFLDRLAEEVAVRTPGLFLAPDMEISPRLEKLRKALAKHVGDELVQAAFDEDADDGSDLGPLVEVLEFLTSHGWRPGGGKGIGICKLCESLAARCDDPPRQRRLLSLALANAETFQDAERVRAKMATLAK